VAVKEIIIEIELLRVILRLLGVGIVVGFFDSIPLP
jgi:hypothetical protein